MGCSSSTLNCSPRAWITPNPDIAGSGVIFSFVTTLGIIILLSILAAITPEYPYRAYHPVDRFAYWLYSKVFGKPLGRRTEDVAAAGSYPVIVRDMLFGLCTQQQVIGIAILVSRAAACDITVYHSEIVRILAYFSMGSQTSAMMAVSDFLINNRRMKYLTLFLFLVMWGMTVHLTILHGNEDVYEEGPTLARCLFVKDLNIGGAPMNWMIFNLIMAILSLILAVDSLFPNHSIVVYKELRDAANFGAKVFAHIAALKQRWVSSTTNNPLLLIIRLSIVALRLVAGVLLATLGTVWVATWAALWLTGGRILSIIFDILWFGTNLWDVLETRASGEYGMTRDTIAKEREWGFGQVLPMVLLVMPLLVACQEVLKHRRRSRPHNLSAAASSMLIPLVPGSSAIFTVAAAAAASSSPKVSDTPDSTSTTARTSTIELSSLDPVNPTTISRASWSRIVAN